MGGKLAAGAAAADAARRPWASTRLDACRAVQEAAAAAAELRGIGIRRPSIYIVSLYNMQRDLIASLLERSAAGAQLRAASDCQVPVPSSAHAAASCVLKGAYASASDYMPRPGLHFARRCYLSMPARGMKQMPSLCQLSRPPPI